MSERLALEQRAALSANILLQLREGGVDSAPLIEILARSNAAAAAAIGRLASVDPEDAKVIRTLQNEIAVFDRIIEMLGDLFKEGREIAESITDERRDEISELTGLEIDEVDDAIIGMREDHV